MEEISPIAMPGTHQKFLAFFEEQSFDTNIKILDVGAGHGAFSKALFEMGYEVQACDLFPEIFKFDKIECKKADITSELPYPDDTFDLVIAIEVLEHILDHEVFFREVSRVLKSDGRFLISTPNILSMKSRIRFLFTGFYYSFKPLEMNNYDGLQHVVSRTLDQYNYIAIKSGLQQAELNIDRKQGTSRWLLIVIGPFMWLYTKLKGGPTLHNSSRLLLGRLLILSFRNN